MRLRTFTVVRLECALHEDDSLKPVVVEGRQRFGAETAPKTRWYGPLKPGVNADTVALALRRDRPPRYLPVAAFCITDTASPTTALDRHSSAPVAWG